MYRIVCLLAIAFLLAAVPCAAQGMPNNARCNLAGTWYGGSPDTPFPYYQGAIGWLGGERYSIFFQYAAEVQSVGYLRATDWTGEVAKAGPHSYSGMAFSMAQWDPMSLLLPPGVDANLPELDFIHILSVQLLDCETLQFSYDLLAVYYNFTNDINPRQTSPPPPGFAMKFDPLLVEVYHRMPMSVPAPWLSTSAATAPPNQANRKLPPGHRR
jgi:hypothetical protein